MTTRRVHRVTSSTPAWLTSLGYKLEERLKDKLVQIQINPDQICTVEPIGEPFPAQMEDNFEVITMSSGIEYIALKEA